MIIITFGKPGAGKGTRISKFLEGRKEEYTTFSVGNELRKARKANSELGRKAAPYMDDGKMVPDGIISDLSVEAIRNEPKNLILDGFPRTIGQAKAMLEAGIFPDLVINLYVDDQEVINRAKDRIVCPMCGESYTISTFKRPQQEGLCDSCKVGLVRREDDREEVVRQRLKVYAEETEPVVDFLRRKGIPVLTILNNLSGAQQRFDSAIEKL